MAVLALDSIYSVGILSVALAIEAYESSTRSTKARKRSPFQISNREKRAWMENSERDSIKSVLKWSRGGWECRFFGS